MKKFGESEIKKQLYPVLICMMGLIFLFAFSSCSRDRRKILALARAYGMEDSASWQERAEDLKKTIRMYEQELGKKVRASEHLGEYYKTLAVLYMDKQMFREALVNLQEAIRFYPEKAILFYFSAVCEARMGKAFAAFEDAAQHFKRAESLYLRALTLEKNHSDALYGLAILYIFELEQPWAAKPFLERLVNNEPSHNDAKFLLARVYVTEGNAEAAVVLYDEISKKTKSSEQKTMAELNKKTILEGAYGR